MVCLTLTRSCPRATAQSPSPPTSSPMANCATLMSSSTGRLLFCVQMKLKIIFSCSGYIHFTGFLGDKSYFFWLLESRSNPSTDPLVVWLTGGPGGHSSSSCIQSIYFISSGCSSQMALLTENGPCWANEYGNGTIPNEFSWTNKANVIWVKLK